MTDREHQVILKEYTYMDFGYPVILRDVEVGCVDGYWAPYINRDEILKQEAKRIHHMWFINGKWPSKLEHKVFNEALDKGYIPEKL